MQIVPLALMKQALAQFGIACMTSLRHTFNVDSSPNHMYVALLSRECWYSNIGRSILSLLLFTLGTVHPRPRVEGSIFVQHTV